MPFRLSGLPLEPFRPLFGLADEELARRGVVRLAAQPSSPCRVTLDDAAVGEAVLLLHYEHQPAPSAYRASGPIFVREAAPESRVTDSVPDSFRPRLFSARAYDSAGLMIDAEVGEGAALEALIESQLHNPVPLTSTSTMPAADASPAASIGSERQASTHRNLVDNSFTVLAAESS